MQPRPLARAAGPALAPLLVLAASACGPETGPFSTRLSPTREPAYYVEQANRYFDSHDYGVAPYTPPAYSELAIRWEWPPWLLLTGYTGAQLLQLDRDSRKATPARVQPRDCRFFDEQPFARCYIDFAYDDGKGGCPIYEEFTFNDAGEMTFIEAWSDLPGFLPMKDKAQDPWAQGEDVSRLSTRVPGLGRPDGRVDWSSEAMREAVRTDEDVADLARRVDDFWGYWVEALAAAGPDLFPRGCGWK